MKVLIISHMYPSPANPISGIFVQKQTEALVAGGVEAVLINPVPWAPFFLRWHLRWRRYAQISHRERAPGQGFTVLHPRYLEFPQGFLFASMAARYYSGMAATVRRLLKKWRPDVIHAHVAFPDGAAAVRLGKEYGIPVVVTVHGMDFLITMQRSEACKHGVQQALNKADRVILVSETLKDNFGIEEWIGRLDKCQVIYNGVNLTDIVTNDRLVTQAGRDSQSAFVLLTVGHLNKKKAHAYVLQALPDLLRCFPKLTYRIVGDGEERGELERLINSLGLRSQVVLLGRLNHQETMAEMAACDIMLLPSWDEGFGIVYLEAMAHGKPVIGTQGEGAARLIEREQVGLTVPARDVAAIADAACKLLSNGELAQAMGQRGREVVLTQFTWSLNAERTLGLYNEMLKEQASIGQME